MAAQFSIRQLLLLTLVAACLITVVKWLLPHVDIQGILELLLLAIPFAILGLASIWAILETRRPMLASMAVLLLALLLGFGFSMVLPALGFWITATTTAAVVLLVSLYFIRRCGFRIRRQRKGITAFLAEELHEEDK